MSSHLHKLARTALVISFAILAACDSSSAPERASETKAASVTSVPSERPKGPSADLTTVLTGGAGPFLGTATPFVVPAGWVEEERLAAGTATSYRAVDLPAHGRFQVEPDQQAEYRTRVLIRRPAPEKFNGTVIVEWFNVSGGVDGAPDFSLMADEVIRKGYAWAGVSAQLTGVEGGAVTVSVPAADSVAGKGLRGIDPARYGALHHPGDAFAYDIYTQVARALRAGQGLGELRPRHLLAIGESQSAAMLVTYANAVQPLARQMDGFLIHSRGAAAAPLGQPGAPLDVMSAFAGAATRIRNDLGVPVLLLQTETDVVVLGFNAARQDDTDQFRLWEIAGAAHADRTLLGPVADSLDCGGEVNDGPQQYVARAALRALERWVRAGDAPPRAERITYDGAPPTPVRDSDGIILGGIRTPLVDAPVATLSGQARPGTSLICLLSGATDPIATDRLVTRYGSRAAYVDAYRKATDAAIAAGFVLPEDREPLLARAQPDRLPG